jgi:hypothetical protein
MRARPVRETLIVGGGEVSETYLVLTDSPALVNSRKFESGTGLSVIDAGPLSTYTLFVDNGIVATVSGTTFTGPVVASGGLTGSLQQISTGIPYLKAGINVTIVTQSNGQVIISASSPPAHFTLNGNFDNILTFPAQFDPPLIMDATRRISSVRLSRRLSGSTGTTRCDVLVDGASIFDTDGNKPQITSSLGNYATNVSTTFLTSVVTASQRIEAEIETAESGSAEDIRLTVTFI